MASSRHEWVMDRKVDRLYPPNMPQGLKRFHQTGNLHFITSAATTASRTSSRTTPSKPSNTSSKKPERNTA